LISVLKETAKIEGIERIRFSSVEPKIVDDEFIEAIKDTPKVCHHFHLSLQSGCNKTLKAMRRRYTAEEYEEAVKKIRAAFDDAAITTDIIVGFPGESEEDFIESCDFAKRVSLAKIHVFPYSPKRGTPAEKMKEQIPNDIKSDRSRRMIEISNELNEKFLEKYIGKNMDVLFERNIGGNIYEGHTGNYITVRAECGRNIANETLPVRIEKTVGEETVFGKIEKY
ncbi:MAG: radical SAM protein, partial [Firmicutes bacterium]|nr:radical SAM protein [Bacillota bacterium]